MDGTVRPPRPILRNEVHHQTLTPLRRLRSWLSDTLTSKAELAEFAKERRLQRLPSTSRTNLIVFVGARGGGGKTTVARAVGGLLSMARCGTVVLMDADRDYGPAPIWRPTRGAPPRRSAICSRTSTRRRIRRSCGRTCRRSTTAC